MRYYICFYNKIRAGTFFCLIVLFSNIIFAQVRGDFKSITSGNWNSAATWQMFDGSIWKDTTTTPGASNSVFIGNNHSVALTQDESCNNLNMHTGDSQNRLTTGSFSLGVSGKLRAYTGSAPGASTSALPITNYWINTSGGGKIAVIGSGRYITTTSEWGGNPPGWRIEIALNAGETGVFNTSFKAAHFIVTSGTALFTLNNTLYSDSGTYGTGTVTIQSGAVLRMKAGLLQRLLVAGANSHFARLVVNGTLAYDSAVVGIIGAAIINFNGTVAYTAAGAQTLVTRSTNTNGAHPNIYTNLELNGSGTKTLGLNTTVNGTLKLAGTSGFSLGSFTLTYGGSSALEYAGSAPQTTTDAELPATGAAPNLTINNANGVTLHDSRTVSGQLTLSDGIVDAGSNTLSIGNAGFVIRTNGHVAGRLQKHIPAGSPAVSYEIGDADDYTPVDLSFDGVTTSGEVTAKTSVGDHPELATSKIDGSRSVNRYWTLENSGVGFSTYDAVFNFAGSDIDGGAVPDDFIVEKYDAPDWTSLNAGTRTSTSTEVTGLTSFSDFAVGEIETYTITATAGPHGSIVPSGVVEVPEGENQQFLINPDFPYYLDSLLVDGTLVDSASSYTFYNVTGNHTITARFKIITHTITATSGPNGTITPLGVILVTHGENQGFNIAADHGYEIDSVLIDGISFGNISFYEFENVTSDHTIDASFGVKKQVVAEFTVFDGWNLVSVPVGAEDFRKTVIFPTAQSDAFAYNGMYEVRDTLTNGKGYWLKFDDSQPISVTGSPRNLDTIGVEAGWNIIGSLTDGIAAASVIPLGTTIESYYFIFNNGYQVTDSIRTGNGTWVKVSDQGQLVLSAYGAEAGVARQQSLSAGDLQLFNSLLVTDKSGMSRFLYFGCQSNSESSSDFYELPPPPPAGSFDARFLNNQFMAIHEQPQVIISEHPLSIQSAHWPVTLTWDVDADRKIEYILQYNSNGRIRKINLGGVEKNIVLTEAEVSSLMLKAIPASVPKEYALEQNYPNPFNPATKIRFALPVKSVVTVKVFNLLGQEVSVLIDGETIDAGYGEVEFTGGNLSSGIYFINFIAGGADRGVDETQFTAVRKMIYAR